MYKSLQFCCQFGVMKKKVLSKIKGYIRDDRPRKLQEYLRKLDIEVVEVELSHRQNLLHYVCKHGSGSVLRLV